MRGGGAGGDGHGWESWWGAKLFHMATRILREITTSFWVPETSIEDKEILYSSHVCLSPCFIAKWPIEKLVTSYFFYGLQIYCQGYWSYFVS